MKKLFCLASFLALFTVSTAWASASNSDKLELMSAAVDLGHRYDSFYARKDAVGMASLYTSEGILVTLTGKVIRGKTELENFYSNSFAAGVQGHSIIVSEVHVIAAGGFAIAKFSLNVPDKNAGLRKVDGSLIAIFEHDALGWHLSLVAPSVPPNVPK